MSLIDVTVKIPGNRLAEFYETTARFLMDGGRTDLSATETMSRFKAKLSPPALALFSLLAENPEERFEAESTADQLGIPHGAQGLAGVLAWPGRHAKKLGMAYPWRWEVDDEGQTVYWMDTETAALFLGAE